MILSKYWRFPDTCSSRTVVSRRHLLPKNSCSSSFCRTTFPSGTFSFLQILFRTTSYRKQVTKALKSTYLPHYRPLTFIRISDITLTWICILTLTLKNVVQNREAFHSDTYTFYSHLVKYASKWYVLVNDKCFYYINLLLIASSFIKIRCAINYFQLGVYFSHKIREKRIYIYEVKTCC